MQTDEQLVDAALNGFESAFDELVVRYQERLLRFLLTRSATREDAEDAIQDTFISAYRYLHSFNPRWQFSTWLYRIALRNISRQGRRDSNTRDEVDLIAAEGCDPLEACIEESNSSNVWLTAKQVLTDDAYSAMWLRYVEDLSVKDVARSLDKSVSWAKVTLMRGRQRLEAEIAAPEAGPKQRFG